MAKETPSTVEHSLAEIVELNMDDEDEVMNT